MIELKNNPAGNFFLLAGPCVIEGEEMVWLGCCKEWVKRWQCALPNE